MKISVLRPSGQAGCVGAVSYLPRCCADNSDGVVSGSNVCLRRKDAPGKPGNLSVNGIRGEQSAPPAQQRHRNGEPAEDEAEDDNGGNSPGLRTGMIEGTFARENPQDCPGDCQNRDCRYPAELILAQRQVQGQGCEPGCDHHNSDSRHGMKVRKDVPGHAVL